MQFQASAVVRDNEGVLETMTERQLGAWDRLVDEVEAWQGDELISQEQLVETSLEDAASALARLQAVADEVHVVVTARDLVRQVPSAWQQRVKHGSPSTLGKFFKRVAKDDPAFNFWHHQDVPRILERWAADLPPAQVHVVVAAAPGCPVRPAVAPHLRAARDRRRRPVPRRHRWPSRLGPGQDRVPGGVTVTSRNAYLDAALSRRVKGFLEPQLGSAAPPGAHRAGPRDARLAGRARQPDGRRARRRPVARGRGPRRPAAGPRARGGRRP